MAEAKTQAPGKGETEFEVKNAEPRRGVKNNSRGHEPPVGIQKQGSPGGATDCNQVRILCRPSRARFKTQTYQGLTPLASLLAPFQGAS
jgi:hypothetical protein